LGRFGRSAAILCQENRVFYRYQSSRSIPSPFSHFRSFPEVAPESFLQQGR